MLARFESEQGVRGVVAHLGFHSHDSGALEELGLRNEFRAQFLASPASRVGGLADADELPVRRGQCELDLVRPVRIGRAEEAEGEARLAHPSVGGTE